tara:strand:+ start:8337 stop:9185 length:849 start_codon:yes stop_codon:yes gene_type:complete
MILVDLNQVAISNLMVSVNGNYSSEINENLIRHMVLNSLRSYRVKFGEEYGELVICCDNRHYWRRELFPFYKASRKKDRAASALDWTLIFETLNKIRDDIKEYFPYKVIDIERAEADDIIGVIVKHSNPLEKILILSGDKDFMQLQKHMNVYQYAPVQKKFLKPKKATEFLKEQILRGDRGDGIPNFLSADDVFVRGVRQKSISKKKLERWMGSEPETFCNEDMLRGYQRNRQLIDLEYIPEDLENEIIQEYSQEDKQDRSKLFNYFVKNKMMQLMDHIQEF